MLFHRIDIFKQTCMQPKHVELDAVLCGEVCECVCTLLMGVRPSDTKILHGPSGATHKCVKM